jgi:hypothetical protein
MSFYSPSVKLKPGNSIDFNNGHTVEIEGVNEERHDYYDVTVDGEQRTWHIDEFERRIQANNGGATIELGKRM